MAKSKARVRNICLVCIGEADEWQLQTSYRRQNRLQSIAICNKHAAIRGTPNLSEEEKALVTVALIATRGASTKKHKEQHKKGDLKLLEKTLSYKGMWTSE